MNTKSRRDRTSSLALIFRERERFDLQSSLASIHQRWRQPPMAGAATVENRRSPRHGIVLNSCRQDDGARVICIELAIQGGASITVSHSTPLGHR